jgi:hypothetical protein
MRLIHVFVVLLCYATLPGCATITSSEMQELSLQTSNEKGESVADVKCTLKNDKGSWESAAPKFVPVRRSAEDLIVECKKDGLPDGFLRAISRAAGGMFGNIIIGGGIGALIDHTRGTGYNYPDNLPVVMGRSVTVDRHTQASTANEEKQTSATSSPPQEQPPEK